MLICQYLTISLNRPTNLRSGSEITCLFSVYHPYVLSPNAAAVSASHVANEKKLQLLTRFNVGTFGRKRVLSITTPGPLIKVFSFFFFQRIYLSSDNHSLVLSPSTTAASASSQSCIIFVNHIDQICLISILSMYTHFQTCSFTESKEVV